MYDLWVGWSTTTDYRGAVGICRRQAEMGTGRDGAGVQVEMGRRVVMEFDGDGETVMAWLTWGC